MKIDETDMIRNEKTMRPKQRIGGPAASQMTHTRTEDESQEKQIEWWNDAHHDRRHHHSPYETPEDVAIIHGVDQESLTGAEANAFQRLVDEIGHLNEALDRAQQRITFLEGQLGHDKASGTYSELGLRQAYGQLQYHQRNLADPDNQDQAFQEQNVEGQALCNALVLFRMGAYEDIQHRYGHDAAEHLVAQVGRILVQEARHGDIIGRRGDHLFVMILVGLSGKGAFARETFMAGKVNGAAIGWNGIKLDVGLSTISYDLKTGEDIDQALDAADHDLKY